MFRCVALIFALCAAGAGSAALADASDRARVASPAGRAELPPYLQCVPYARKLSGVQIYGDAHTWWGQAKGRYSRGNKPRVGAVMAFAPHRNMRLGHVAAVSKVIDSRTILLDHANWSPINGRRGQIERNVKAIDISPGNDWSQVRVWYHPIQALGKTPWPVHGFIYPKKAGLKRSAVPATQPVRPKPVRRESSRAFKEAFSSLDSAIPAGQRRKVSSPPTPRPAPASRKPVARKPSAYPLTRPSTNRKREPKRDSLDSVLARYE